ncbi:uncharacterized protein LOC117133729 isoform X2 [Brassica rapa]|uniref:uncharacterized protein LOC117133729 isoform X2 n=1 Tax=Brassica campestris TaxID=3711 RepID=UPI00142D2C21|nr:uncharacterized protein LOC117133729 isoform X2 [Brassica rapa]
MNPDPGLSMVSEHSHPLDSAFPDSTSNSEWRDEMMALLIKWRAEDKERFMKWRAEDQERQLKYDNLRQTLPQMTMKTDLDPVEKTHKPSGNFVEQMVCDPPDKALDGDRFGFADGDSQVHNTFIPKRYEDLKRYGGIRFRRIPIKLIYHKARFKKRKRRLIRGKRELSVSQKLKISTNSLRLVVKSVRTKKQYHRKKRATQIKLAEACKSLGMFCESSGYRDTKRHFQIRLGTRKIWETGVKRETHPFVYGFTSHTPMDIDGHVDTWIGDQSIFAEELKALDHDDNDAVMESLQYETSVVSEFKEMAKCKRHKVQQKWGKRGFHKVRFKVILHQRNKVAAEKVTKGGEPFKLGNSESLHTRRSKYTRRLFVKWCYFKARKRKQYKMGFIAQIEHVLPDSSHENQTRGQGRKIYPGGFQFPQWPQFIKSCSKIYHVSGSANLQTEETGESHKSVQFELSLFNGKIKGKPPEGDSENRREALEYKVSVSENGGSNLELIGGNGTDNFSFSIYVKQQTGRLVKTFCGRQLLEFCLAVQVWEPGGKSDKDVQLVDVHYQFINGREWDFLESVEELSKVEPRPPEMIKPKNLVSLLDTGALVTELIEDCNTDALMVTASIVHQLEDKLVLHRGSIDKRAELEKSKVEQLREVEEWLAHALQAVGQEMQRRVYKNRLRLRRVLAQVGELENLSLVEACEGTYAGISYTGAAVGDVWDIIAHIKKFLEIENGFGVEINMGSWNFVTKGATWCSVTRFWFKISGCYYIFKVENHSISVSTYEAFQSPRPPELILFIVRFRQWKSKKLESGVVENKTRAMLSSNDRTWSQVYGAFPGIIFWRTWCRKLIEDQSRVGILIAEMASLTKVAGAVLQGLSLWILAEEQVQGGGIEEEILRILNRVTALLLEIAYANLRTSRISNGGVLISTNGPREMVIGLLKLSSQ